jgi:hypothetical protein
MLFNTLMNYKNLAPGPAPAAATTPEADHKSSTTVH